MKKKQRKLKKMEYSMKKRKDTQRKIWKSVRKRQSDGWKKWGPCASATFPTSATFGEIKSEIAVNLVMSFPRITVTSTPRDSSGSSVIIWILSSIVTPKDFETALKLSTFSFRLMITVFG